MNENKLPQTDVADSEAWKSYTYVSESYYGRPVVPRRYLKLAE